MTEWWLWGIIVSVHMHVNCCSGSGVHKGRLLIQCGDAPWCCALFWTTNVDIAIMLEYTLFTWNSVNEFWNILLKLCNITILHCYISACPGCSYCYIYTVVPRLSGLDYLNTWLPEQFQVKYHNQNIYINTVVFNGLQKFCK